MAKYHPVTDKIQELLKKEGIAFKTFEHAPVRTSEEAMRQRPEYTLKQGAKALVVGYRIQGVGDRTPEAKPLGSGKQFAMFVMPADRRLDEKKVRAILETRKISFATKEEADAITGGVEFGGVPPFGHLFGLQVYIDPALFENEEIIFNAGDRSFSIVMMAEDYRTVALANGAKLCDISEYK